MLMTAAEEISHQQVCAPDEDDRSLHSEWEELLGHPLTDDEFEEIQDNLAAFFGLLHEWDLDDSREAAENTGQDADFEGGQCK